MEVAGQSDGVGNIGEAVAGIVAGVAGDDQATAAFKEFNDAGVFGVSAVTEENVRPFFSGFEQHGEHVEETWAAAGDAECRVGEPLSKSKVEDEHQEGNERVLVAGGADGGPGDGHNFVDIQLDTRCGCGLDVIAGLHETGHRRADKVL